MIQIFTMCTCHTKKRICAPRYLHGKAKIYKSVTKTKLPELHEKKTQNYTYMNITFVWPD